MHYKRLLKAIKKCDVIKSKPIESMMRHESRYTYTVDEKEVLGILFTESAGVNEGETIYSIE